MADNITNITNSTNEVKASFDKMTSSMKNLVALQMAQLTKSSAEYASNIDDATNKFKKLFDLENRHIKKLKEANSLEEEKIKLEERLEKLKKMSLASDKAKEQIEKRIQDLKNKKLDKEEDLIREINKLRKEGLDIDEKEIDSQEDLIKFLENRRGLLLRNVEITKEQSKELRRQYAIYKNHGALAAALNKKWTDIKKNFTATAALNKMSSLTKGWLTQLSGIYSLGKLYEQVKDNITFYRKSMWDLGVSIRGANDGLISTAKHMFEVNTAFAEACETAAKFGIDTGRVRDTMEQLSSKVLFLKRELGETGKIINRFDATKVGNVTQVMSVFAKTMGMDISEAVEMYSESIRKFGYSSGQAVKQMSKLQAETITFNTMLVDFFSSTDKGFNDFENVTVFANEIGRAMLELQQGTRYWVQDLQMMNTQFNTHINLLIKQGKSQKEALAIAKNFQKIVTEPTSQLAKYNIGKELRKRYLKGIESAGANATEQQKREAGALAMGLATKNEKGEVVYENMKMKEVADQLFYLMEVRNKHGRGRDVELTQANIFQDLMGPLKLGREVGFDYQSKFTQAHDLTVASGQGIGESAKEALDMTILMEKLKEYGLENIKDRNEAIRILRTKEFDEFYGGLDEAGKATKELVDSFLKSKESAEWQKANLEGTADLTLEQAALKFRESKINESISGTQEELKANTKVNETTGEIIIDKLSQENSTLSNISSFVESIKNSLIGKAGVGAGAFMLDKGIDIVSMMVNLAMLKKMKGTGGGLLNKDIVPQKVKNLLTKNKVPKEVSGSVGNAVEKIKAKNIKSEPGKLNVDRRAIREQVKKEMPTANRKIREAEVQKRLLSKKPTITDANGIVSNVSKTGGKLGKNLLKRSPIGLGFAALDIGSNLAQGNVKGAAGSAVSTTASIIGGAIGSAIAPGIGTVLGSVAGGFIGDFIGDKVFGENNTIDKDALFENFNKVTSSMDLLPENVDKAIEEYAKQSKDLSEDEIEKLKQSLRDSYSETYKEAQKSNTKNPEAILLRKKLEYGQLSQAELQQQQIEQEKEQYNKLDDLGKIISNQEKMFSLHDQWFSFVVETETRKLLDDRSLSKDQRRQRIKGMLGGAAGGRIKQAIDASNVTTWRVEGAGVSAAIQGKGMLD